MNIRNLVLSFYRTLKDHCDLSGFESCVSVREKVKVLVEPYISGEHKFRFYISHPPQNFTELVAEAMDEDDFAEHELISNPDKAAIFIVKLLSFTGYKNETDILQWIDILFSPAAELHRAVFNGDMLSFRKSLRGKSHTKDAIISAYKLNAMLDSDIVDDVKFQLLASIKSLLSSFTEPRFTVTVILTPFEAKTVVTEENSPVVFVRNILEHLPDDSQLQVINIELTDLSRGHVCFDFSQIRMFSDNPKVAAIHNVEIDPEYDSPELVVADIPSVLERIACSHMFFVHPLNASGMFDNFDIDEKPVSVESDRFLKSHASLIDLTHARFKGRLQEVSRDYSDLSLFQAYLSMQEFGKAQQIISKVRSHMRGIPKNRLIILTDVPDGTLGDASAASKLLNILSRTPGFDKLEFYWVIRESNGHLKIRDFIPEAVGEKRLIELTHWSHLHSDPRMMELLLTSNPLILSFPTCAYLSDHQVKFLGLFGRVLDIGEYDLEQDVSSGPHPKLAPFMQMGLSEGSLGIFSDPLKFEAADDSGDTSVPMTAAGGFPPRYTDELNNIIVRDAHNYLCYSNLDTDSTMNNNVVSIATFSFVALQRSLAMGIDTINIMCRADADTFSTIKDIIETKFSGAIARIEYRIKGKLVEGKVFAETGATLILDNIFPLTHELFLRALMEPQRGESRRVEPFCLLTGDGSITEGLMAGIPVMYQIQNWKYFFYKSLLYRSLLYKITPDLYKGAQIHQLGEMTSSEAYNSEAYKSTPPGTTRYLVYKCTDSEKCIDVIKVFRADGSFGGLSSISNMIHESDPLYHDTLKLNKKIIYAICLQAEISSFLYAQDSTAKLPEHLTKYIVNVWFSLQNINTMPEQVLAKIFHLLAEHGDALQEGMKEFAAYLQEHHNVRHNLAKVLYEQLQDMLDDGSMKYLKRPGASFGGLPAIDRGTVIVPREVLEQLMEAKQVVDMQPVLSMPLMEHHARAIVKEDPRVDGFHPETLEALRKSKLHGYFLKN